MAVTEQKILVSLQDVKQHFTVRKARGKKATLYAVDGVDLEIYEGETLGLVGESGCGKSTLGKTLLGLYPLTDGTVLFEGVDPSLLRGKERLAFHRRAQMIFQDPASCLNPRRTIFEILEEPYLIHKLGDASLRKEKILELCGLVGLSADHLERYPHELSGGQKQRVGIARALALSPKIIVCDEAVSALDVSIQAQVINLLQDLQEKLGLSYLFISHNLSVVKHCSNRIGVMYLGRMVELAPADTLYHEPLHPYTRALISAVPSLESESRTRIVLEGDLPSPVSPPEGCAFHTRCPHAFDRCKVERPVLTERSPGHVCACHLEVNP